MYTKRLINEFKNTHSSKEISDIPRPMINYIKSNGKQNLVGAEIGVYKGINALSILQELPIDKLYLIDPYVLYEDWHKAASYKDMELNNPDTIYNEAILRLSDYSNKITFIKHTSSQSKDLIPDNLDFVYIDGNHESQYVYEDIINYYPKIKEGGIIGGHDYHRYKVQIAVHRVFREVYQDLGDWWVIKGEIKDGNKPDRIQ
jgi:hypothetical protein